MPTRKQADYTRADSSEPTVNEIVLAYLRHSLDYYPDSPREQEKIKYSVRLLKQLYGRQSAHTFDVLALEAVRDEMIKTLARTTRDVAVDDDGKSGNLFGFPTA